MTGAGKGLTVGLQWGVGAANPGGMSLPKPPRCFQDVILTLQAYWAGQGCVILQAYDEQVGAGTLSPATTLRALGPKPWRAAYVQPSRRPKDGRYGDNPNRLYQHHQFQVILKPNPPDLQDLYLGSLDALGLDPLLHDIRFVEDDWENPTVGAWGLGWEVWCDGMEVSQYTYFQQVGGLDARPVSGELTYGLERLSMYVLGHDRVYDMPFNAPDSPFPLTYGDVFLANERDQSRFSFELSDPKMSLAWFEDAEATAQRLLAADPPNILPAFEYTLKASHLFNLLDARGVVSPTERQSFIARVRTLAKGCAEAWEAREGGGR
jgi:glycyl-tRNA synthetase alpha chain